MLVKTSKLLGQQLDWAVTTLEEPEICIEHFMSMHDNYGYIGGTFSYSTKHGYEIVERERITITQTSEILTSIFRLGVGFEFKERGPTPLIAAMRTYVASKLGETVEIPEELC
jgi:hypothetical protein